MRVTPVPIPNTMVKTQAADGTSLETVRESRWPPGYKKLKNTIADPVANVRDDSYSIQAKDRVNNLSAANLISKEVLL